MEIKEKLSDKFDPSNYHFHDISLYPNFNEYSQDKNVWVKCIKNLNAFRVDQLDDCYSYVSIEINKNADSCGNYYIIRDGFWEPKSNDKTKKNKIIYEGLISTDDFFEDLIVHILGSKFTKELLDKEQIKSICVFQKK